MKRRIILAVLLITVCLAVAALTGEPGQALPEYAAQTGEPCGSCHISPSGGGLRSPRGQAWVGTGKPGEVPELTEALSILGVHLEVDERDYAAPTQPIPPAKPLHFKAGQAAQFHAWLRDYQ